VSDGSGAEANSEFEDTNELSLLDETRESKNPNFECWQVNPF
jgi:hypothetical protein